MTTMMMTMMMNTNSSAGGGGGGGGMMQPCIVLLLIFLLFPTSTNLFAVAFASRTPTNTHSSGRSLSRLDWQDDLLQSSQPLEPTPLSGALDALQHDGVVRLQDVHVNPQLCHALRERILHEIQGKSPSSSSRGGGNGEEPPCKYYVPGTRLRFRESMDLAFGGDARHDLLLPLETWSELTSVLQSVVGQIEPLLQRGAHKLLPRLYGSSSSSSSSEKEENLTPVELVELASLVVRPGSTHQPFHGDFRRFLSDSNLDDETATTTATMTTEPKEHTEQRQGKLPPRLVTFVALQDVTTRQHGATAFVTGTQTGTAHELVYGGGGESEFMKHEKRRKEIKQMSTSGVRTTEGFLQGDVLVYDASVLHWGSTNSVPLNDRAMLYFGVSRPGDAALLSSHSDAMVKGGFVEVPPVTLQQVLATYKEE